MSKKNIDGFDLNFSSDWTKKIESLDHWTHYWRQSLLVERYVDKSEKILEIGVGSGFLQKYLTSRGWKVFSLDIDEDKNPDFVSDASSFNFKDISPSCFLAFEIFEHIPFPLFSRTINNIAKSKPAIIIFSLPMSLYYVFKLTVKLPMMPEINIRIPIPKFKIKTPNHYWELGLYGSPNPKVLDGQKKGVVSINDVEATFNKCGYHVEEVGKEGKIKFFAAYPEIQNEKNV